MIHAGTAGGSALAIVLLLAACGQAPEAGIDPRDPAQVSRGEAVYAAHCASCHGARLEGQPDWRRRRPDGRLPAPPHDGTGHTWHHPNEVLFGITKEGLGSGKYAPPGYRSDMPAFGGVLGDEDIRAVLAYIQSRWPPEVWQARNDRLAGRGS